MKAKVDSKLCSGCGACEIICPEVFEMRGDVAVVKAEQVPATAEGFCLEAANVCASRAICVKEELGLFAPQRHRRDPFQGTFDWGAKRSRAAGN